MTFYDDFELEVICDMYFVENDDPASFTPSCPGNDCLSAVAWVEEQKYIYIMDKTAEAPATSQDLWIQYDYTQTPPCQFTEEYTAVNIEDPITPAPEDWVRSPLPSHIKHHFEIDDVSQKIQIWTDPDTPRPDQEGWWYPEVTGVLIDAHPDDNENQVRHSSYVKIAVVDCEAVTFLDQDL